MFRNKLKKQAKKEVETQIKDLQLYLENNYKDLAIQARKEAIRLLEEYRISSTLDEKSYTKYKKILDDYTKNMENYNHQQFYRS